MLQIARTMDRTGNKKKQNGKKNGPNNSGPKVHYSEDWVDLGREWIFMAEIVEINGRPLLLLMGICRRCPEISG
jgi:hypothetical protein